MDSEGTGTGLAYGYRFANPDYRRNYSKVVITSKALRKRLKDLRDSVKYPVQKHLRRMLEELGAVMPDDAELLALCRRRQGKGGSGRGNSLRPSQRGRTVLLGGRKTQEASTPT